MVFEGTIGSYRQLSREFSVERKCIVVGKGRV